MVATITSLINLYLLLEEGEIRAGAPEGDSGDYQATIYYRTDWNHANIHYRIEGGLWTECRE